MELLTLDQMQLYIYLPLKHHIYIINFNKYIFVLIDLKLSQSYEENSFIFFKKVEFIEPKFLDRSELCFKCQ